MKKYRKKPVVIDAIQFDGVGNDVVDSDVMFIMWPIKFDEDKNPYLVIKTLEGDMRCSEGDYIIRGIQGEYYPCKPDIFKATYEEVADGTSE